MPKTYTRTQAQAIWDMADKLSGIAQQALRDDGWTVKSEWDGDWWCRIDKFIPDPTGQGLEENERNLWIVLDVTRDGKVSFRHTDAVVVFEDIPLVLRLLGQAMKPLVGPYTVANSEW